MSYQHEDQIVNLKKNYRSIFYIPSKQAYLNISSQIDLKHDLILTFDFGLKKLIKSLGGECHYIDKLLPALEMQKNNFIIQEFIEKWHLNSDGEDLFTYKKFEFGQSFQIYFISELYNVVRIGCGLSILNNLKFEQLILINPEKIIEEILTDLDILHTVQIDDVVSRDGGYFFDVNKYMNQALNEKTLKYQTFFAIKNILNRLLHISLIKSNTSKKLVYFQLHHPTIAMFKKMNNSIIYETILAPGVHIGNFLEKIRQRNFYVIGINKTHQLAANNLNMNYQKKRCRDLILSNGINLTKSANRTIDKYVIDKTKNAIQIIESIEKFFSYQSLDLLILVTNFGFFDSILHSYAKKFHIPTYMIINGMLIAKHGNDSKSATLINAYSIQMAQDYFKDCNNVLSIGDPRMDRYFSTIKVPIMNSKSKSIAIGIGAAGFNNTDLASYSAYEFDFIFECLEGIRRFEHSSNLKVDIKLRIRANSFIQQYREFINEFFPDLTITYCQGDLLNDFLGNLDLYITFYSQTLFEASAIGVPVIYFKIDEEDLYAPFDAKSELVTVGSMIELSNLLMNFQYNKGMYTSFMKRETLEKYIGFLDGTNLDRNMNVIESLLEYE